MTASTSASSHSHNVCPVHPAAVNSSSWSVNRTGIIGDRTFDQWFGFLRGQELVAEEGTDVTISRVGIEFLK